MLQKTVSVPALGVPGQQVAYSGYAYTPLNFLSDGTVKAGGFAYRSTATYNGTAEKENIASATGTELLGLVERTFTASLDGEDPDVYAEGEEITIAIRGDFVIEAPAVATIGQAVICDPATGKVTFGTVGASNDTGWVVAQGANEGEPCVISRH